MIKTNLFSILLIFRYVKVRHNHGNSGGGRWDATFASLPVVLAWSYYHYRRSRTFQHTALSLLRHFVREVFMIHVGCTRCVTSSTANTMNMLV